MIQNKGIEKDIECIGFEGFTRVRFKKSIGASRGGLHIFYPYAKGGPIQPYLGHEVRRNHNKENKRIQVDLINKVMTKLPNSARRLFQQI